MWDVLVSETLVEVLLNSDMSLNTKGDGSTKGKDENSVRDQCDSYQTVNVKVTGWDTVSRPLKFFTVRRKNINLACKSCISKLSTYLGLDLAFTILVLIVHALLHIISILQEENKVFWCLACQHCSSLHEPVIWNWHWKKLKWRSSPLGTCRKG